MEQQQQRVTQQRDAKNDNVNELIKNQSIVNKLLNEFEIVCDESIQNFDIDFTNVKINVQLQQTIKKFEKLTLYYYSLIELKNKIEKIEIDKNTTKLLNRIRYDIELLEIYFNDIENFFNN